MQNIVLDTSVILKWYLRDEAHADKALALKNAYTNGEIHITVPAHLVYEFTNVLRYKPELTTEQVQTAVQNLLKMDLSLVSPTSDVMSRSVQIARTFDVTIYDSVFVALAEAGEMDCISADEEAVKKMMGTGRIKFLGA